MGSHARSWACNCGAHLMVTYQTEHGPQVIGSKFSCPRCHAVHLLPPLRGGERMRADTLKVQRS